MLLARAYVAPQYHKIFYDYLYRFEKNNEELIFIDGGVHQGVFTDIALACGGTVYGFEPNRFLSLFLRKLYKNNPKFIFYEAAIGAKAETLQFLDGGDGVISQGGSVVHFTPEYKQCPTYNVQCVDFPQFVADLIQKHGKIHFIKLDIEGADFAVMDALLERDLLQNVEYVMVETHERLFPDPAATLQKLKDKIAAKKLTNIYLDWV